MKNQLAFLLFFMCWAVPALIPAQDEAAVKEAVSVINVEVPVRVFAEGRPVTDLKKEDFAVYEDGKPQTINGFQQITKKVARSTERPEDAALSASRYFVLAFRVFDFNDSLQQGLQYVFDHVLSPQDQLLVLINEKTRAYPNLADKERARAEIEDDLRDQCHRARNALQANTREINDWVHTMQTVFDSEKIWDSKGAFIRDFLQKYLEMITLFKRRFLTQDIDRYYHFARYLERVRKEKWVLNFYQQELLPRMKSTQHMMEIVRAVISECEESEYAEPQAWAIILKRMLHDLESESATGVEFPIEQVSKLFLKVNATFHTIFINPQMDADSQNLEYRQLVNGIQSNLRDLTKKTGGKLVASSDLVSSLGAIALAEDHYYMLTYSPDNPAKIGRIKVRVNNKKYEVLYDDNLRADYIKDYLSQKERKNPTVKIKGLALNGKELSLTLQDYALAKVKDETSGWLKIHIVVQNSDKQVFFNQTKVLKAGSKTFSLSLDFPFLQPGRYDFIIEVLDQVSGKTFTEVIQPVIK